MTMEPEEWPLRNGDGAPRRRKRRTPRGRARARVRTRHGGRSGGPLRFPTRPRGSRGTQAKSQRHQQQARNCRRGAKPPLRGSSSPQATMSPNARRPKDLSKRHVARARQRQRDSKRRRCLPLEGRPNERGRRASLHCHRR
eukprot:Amastigsp_a841303_17.p4 type:complete len:141 gc:universal Amastigsp_a841303_17:1471-1893(+)